MVASMTSVGDTCRARMSSARAVAEVYARSSSRVTSGVLREVLGRLVRATRTTSTPYRSNHDTHPRHRRRRLRRLGLGRGAPRGRPRGRRPRRRSRPAIRRRSRTAPASTRARTRTRRSWPACWPPSGSRPSSIARRARWSASRVATRRSTTATTSPAAWPCSRRRGRPASTGSCSPRPPRSTASPTRRRSPRTRPAADQPVRRDEADVRGRPALVRRGVRAAKRQPPLLQRRRRDRGARRGPRSRDAPHPERPARPPRVGAPLTVFGDDYPTPGRDVHPRLHPRRGPRRRAPARPRGDRPGRPADGPSRSSATSATAAASASARSSPPPSASSAARSRSRSGSVAPATRRSSSRADRARGGPRLGRRSDPALDEMVGVGLGLAPAPPGRLPGLTRRLARLERRGARREPVRRAAVAGMRPRRPTSPDPAQSSRTGQTSHSPMSIVTSRLRTATW